MGDAQPRPTACSVEGCDLAVKGRGLCSTHYARWRTTGSTETKPRGPTPHPASERVLARVDHDGDCWIYQSSRERPMTTIGSLTDGTRRHERVYRIVYEALVGPIPEGHDLHHLCRHPACVNPAHLLPLTRAEHTALERNRLGTGRQ